MSRTNERSITSMILLILLILFGSSARGSPVKAAVQQPSTKMSAQRGGIVPTVEAANVVQKLDPVRPAEVVKLKLAELGLIEGADSVTVSGAITDVLLKNGYLLFLTPGDIGRDQEAEFSLEKNGVIKTYSVTIATERHFHPTENSEGANAERLANPLRLEVTGLGLDNNFIGQSVTLKLIGAPVLEFGKESDATVRNKNRKGIDFLSEYWTYNAQNNSFTIAGNNLARLLETLPTGWLNLNINFVASNAVFAANFDLPLVSKGKKVVGQLITQEGQPVPELGGRKILLKGYDGQIRKVAIVDANGNFSFENLTPDMYFITLGDLENPGFVSTHFVLDADSPGTNVTLVYEMAENITATRAKSNANTVHGGPSNRSNEQRLKLPSKREDFRKSLGVKPATLSPDPTENWLWDYVMSGEANVPVSKLVSYGVPPGTKNVRIKVIINTHEQAPNFPGEIGNHWHPDSWSYSISGIPEGPFSEASIVTESHVKHYEKIREWCVDVSELTQVDYYHEITAKISTMNAGDSTADTWVDIEFDTDCDKSKIIIIKHAKFLSPNKDGHLVLQPLKKSMAPGPYLSVPVTSSIATHTLPLEIAFEPSNAQINEVNVSISPDNENSFSPQNLIVQNHLISNGKLKFTGLSLPVFPYAETEQKVIVKVRVKGLVDGESAESDPAAGGTVDFKGNEAFVPLFLANDRTALGGRRYGTRDAGGDSWATMQMIDWLTGNRYRFDDISAQHVTQTAAGRSILDHAGHSNGQQVDLRYADGNGGFTETLGGANNGTYISALNRAARQEVETNAVNKPNLAKLQAWIRENRSVIWAELANPDTTTVHIGLDFIKDAIIYGKFSGSPELFIPGIQSITKHPNLKPVGGHLNHWHVSKELSP